MADSRACDYYSLLLEQRLQLKVEYNALTGRLYVTEVVKARDREKWFRDLIENGRTACDDPDPYKQLLPTCDG